MRTKKHLQKKTVTKIYKKINLTKQIKKQKLKKTRINKLIGGDGDNTVKSKIMICTRNEYTYLIPVLEYLERRYNFMNSSSSIDIIYARNSLQPILKVPQQLYSTTLKYNLSKPQDILIEAIEMGTHPFIIYIDDENEIIKNNYSKNDFDKKIKTQFYFELYSYSYNETEPYKKIEMSSITEEMQKDLERIINTIPANTGLCLCIQLPHEQKSICDDMFFEQIRNILLFINTKFNNNLLTAFDFDNTLTKLHLYKSIYPGIDKDKYTEDNEKEFNDAFLKPSNDTDELKEAQIVKYFGPGNIEKIKSLFQIVKSIEQPTNSNKAPPVPSRATKPENKYFSNPFLTNEKAVKADFNMDMRNVYSVCNALQPSKQYLSGNKKINNRTTIELFKLPILDKIDSYVKDEKELGDRFRSAIEAKKNSTLLKTLYPPYFNKCAEPKIDEYSKMEKKITGFVKKTNKTAPTRKRLLKEIMPYGFQSEEIKNFIRLQHHMPKILKTLTYGVKTEGMFKVSDDKKLFLSFYTNPKFELTSEVLEDTDTLCTLVKNYIGLLSKIKGSYFEEEIKTEKDFKISKDIMLKKYLSYYPKEDQELLNQIFGLFSLIMDNDITNMRPEDIGIIFMPNGGPSTNTKDRIIMYQKFFEHINEIYKQPQQRPQRPQLPLPIATLPAAASAPPPPPPPPPPPIPAPAASAAPINYKSLLLMGDIMAGHKLKLTTKKELPPTPIIQNNPFIAELRKKLKTRQNKPPPKPTNPKPTNPKQRPPVAPKPKPKPTNPKQRPPVAPKPTNPKQRPPVAPKPKQLLYVVPNESHA